MLFEVATVVLVFEVVVQLAGLLVEKRPVLSVYGGYSALNRLIKVAHVSVNIDRCLAVIEVCALVTALPVELRRGRHGYRLRLL